METGCRLVAASTTRLDNLATSDALLLKRSSWMSICWSCIHSITSSALEHLNSSRLQGRLATGSDSTDEELRCWICACNCASCLDVGHPLLDRVLVARASRRSSASFNSFSHTLLPAERTPRRATPVAWPSRQTSLCGQSALARVKPHPALAPS